MHEHGNIDMKQSTNEDQNFSLRIVFTVKLAKSHGCIIFHMEKHPSCPTDKFQYS